MRMSQEIQREVLYLPIFDPLQLFLISYDSLPILTLYFRVILREVSILIMEIIIL